MVRQALVRWRAPDCSAVPKVHYAVACPTLRICLAPQGLLHSFLPMVQEIAKQRERASARTPDRRHYHHYSPLAGALCFMTRQIDIRLTFISRAISDGFRPAATA